MTTSSTPEYEKPTNSNFEVNKDSSQSPQPKGLPSDPDYLKLLEHYQQAKFKECKEMLSLLENRYPNHPTLLKFKEELEMKLSVKSMSASIAAGEKRLKRKATIKLGIFTLIAALVILIAFFLSLFFFAGDVDIPDMPEPVSQEETTQLGLFYQQAQQLLQVGQPQPAAEIIEKIRAIDPEFPGLAELTARTEQLLQLETQYQAALDLLAENNFDQALESFREIEAQEPGLWDVSKRITAIETAQQIAQYMKEGDAAFQASNWTQTISAYEAVLRLDPRADNPLMKEQLVNSYLNQIISMLEKENTSLEDIERAEGYYRKAIAMIPQDRAYITERGNLQEVSRDLLFLKFTQIAKDNLENTNQTAASVNLAVTYLRKAAELKPENAAVQQDLQNAEYYHTGFREFINKNWIGAINNFEQIIPVNPNFANGNATILLFEAYTAIARRYLATSVYPDALSYLEKAEFLVWGHDNNLANLFQTQVLIGDILGRMGDYENAVSYYQYALNAIQAPTKVQNFPAISTRLVAADAAAANEDYESAFHTFQDVLNGIIVIYTVSEIEISGGVNLALFANANLSTLDLVLEANDLPRDMVIARGQTLQVPTIEN